MSFVGLYFLLCVSVASSLKLDSDAELDAAEDERMMGESAIKKTDPTINMPWKRVGPNGRKHTMALSVSGGGCTAFLTQAGWLTAVMDANMTPPETMTSCSGGSWLAANFLFGRGPGHKSSRTHPFGKYCGPDFTDKCLHRNKYRVGLAEVCSSTSVLQLSSAVAQWLSEEFQRTFVFDSNEHVPYETYWNNMVNDLLLLPNNIDGNTKYRDLVATQYRWPDTIWIPTVAFATRDRTVDFPRYPVEGWRIMGFPSRKLDWKASRWLDDPILKFIGASSSAVTATIAEWVETALSYRTEDHPGVSSPLTESLMKRLGAWYSNFVWRTNTSEPFALMPKWHGHIIFDTCGRDVSSFLENVFSLEEMYHHNNRRHPGDPQYAYPDVLFVYDSAGVLGSPFHFWFGESTRGVFGCQPPMKGDFPFYKSTQGKIFEIACGESYDEKMQVKQQFFDDLDEEGFAFLNVNVVRNDIVGVRGNWSIVFMVQRANAKDETVNEFLALLTEETQHNLHQNEFKSRLGSLAGGDYPLTSKVMMDFSTWWSKRSMVKVLSVDDQLEDIQDCKVLRNSNY